MIGFNVRPSAEVAASSPSAQGIEIRLYRVIYQLTEEIEQALVGMLTPVETEAIIGEVEVRALFKVSRLGTIAGCMVTSGVVRRGSHVRLFREGTRIHETTVARSSASRTTSREVTEGFECGILLEGFNDLREGDVFEVYETREVERTSLDDAPPARRPPPRQRVPTAVRRDPLRRAALPGGALAEGEAEARPLGEGPPAEPLRRRRSPRSTTTSSGSAPA